MQCELWNKHCIYTCTLIFIYVPSFSLFLSFSFSLSLSLSLHISFIWIGICSNISYLSNISIFLDNFLRFRSWFYLSLLLLISPLFHTLSFSHHAVFILIVTLHDFMKNNAPRFFSIISTSFSDNFLRLRPRIWLSLAWSLNLSADSQPLFPSTH